MGWFVDHVGLWQSTHLRLETGRNFTGWIRSLQIRTLRLQQLQVPQSIRLPGKKREALRSQITEQYLVSHDRTNRDATMEIKHEQMRLRTDGRFLLQAFARKPNRYLQANSNEAMVQVALIGRVLRHLASANDQPVFRYRLTT